MDQHSQKTLERALKLYGSIQAVAVQACTSYHSAWRWYTKNEKLRRNPNLWAIEILNMKMNGKKNEK
jgi:molybdenum-dependent DNA-binding transcriptional regulator ModE